MTRYKTLLAKSWNRPEATEPPPESRLLTHLRAVQAAGVAIADTCGSTILENLGLEYGVWFPRLRTALSMSGLLHDLGKANSYFQGMVRGKPDFPPTSQPIRHELLSVMILLKNCGGVATWLKQEIRNLGQEGVDEEMFCTIVSAVAGHHVKMDEDWTKAFTPDRGGNISLELYLGHVDLQPLFGAPGSAHDETWPLLPSKPGFPGKLNICFKQQSLEWQDQLNGCEEWKRFAAVVKSLTIAADVAGSALLPAGAGVKGWIAEVLARRATQADLEGVATKRLDGRSPRPFQLAIAETQSRVTLVEAGCGSGKTAAAWLWAANHAKGRKLFFCYPTTGTATEGFLDYVAESEVEGALIHSRASVDLEGVAMSRDGNRDDEHEDQQVRITSLNAWAPQAVVCTIDTVLALPRNNRRGLYASPAILSACFVFDEVHAYDDGMFSAMVAMILAMPGTPFLLMSASLPLHRRTFLNNKLSDIGAVEPPAELEAIPRYSLERTDRAEAFTQAAEQVRKGKRVLWVCNVVSRVQALFEQAKAAGLPVVAYHSRFRYQDRVTRHREVVNQFAAPSGEGLLAITTQVAEMSLDLDADLLVTELAPIPALIQRLGRLNRRVSECNAGTPRLGLVVNPESELPYKKDELALTTTWIDNLILLGRPLSQRALAEQFKQLASDKKPRLDLRMEWLDSGWCAVPGTVREAGFNVTVILAEDEADCRASSKALIKSGFPMTYNKRMEAWRMLRGAFIAPHDAITYDEHKGAIWAS